MISLSIAITSSETEERNLTTACSGRAIPLAFIIHNLSAPLNTSIGRLLSGDEETVDDWRYRTLCRDGVVKLIRRFS